MPPCYATATSGRSAYTSTSVIERRVPGVQPRFRALARGPSIFFGEILVTFNRDRVHTFHTRGAFQKSRSEKNQTGNLGLYIGAALRPSLLPVCSPMSAATPMGRHQIVLAKCSSDRKSHRQSGLLAKSRTRNWFVPNIQRASGLRRRLSVTGVFVKDGKVSTQGQPPRCCSHLTW